MDKFVRRVDGQTRDANRKEEAKQSKNACMASKGQALQQKRKRKRRKQTRLSESRKDRDLDGLAKLSVPCSRPQPLLCSHGKVRPEQHRGRGRAGAASLRCACGQDSSSATGGGPTSSGASCGLCGTAEATGEEWEDI
eukprot:1161490-Pelagomonas_calceolata.AAC.1